MNILCNKNWRFLKISYMHKNVLHMVLKLLIMDIDKFVLIFYRNNHFQNLLIHGEISCNYLQCNITYVICLMELIVKILEKNIYDIL